MDLLKRIKMHDSQISQFQITRPHSGSPFALPTPTRPLGPLPDPYPIPGGYLIPTGQKINRKSQYLCKKVQKRPKFLTTMRAMKSYHFTV